MANLLRKAGTVATVKHQDMGDGTHAEAVLALAGAAVGSDGVVLDLNSLAQTLAYNADGTINTITVTSGGNTYVQTMTYTGGNLTGISAWVKQ